MEEAGSGQQGRRTNALNNENKCILLTDLTECLPPFGDGEERRGGGAASPTLSGTCQ